MSDTGEIYDHTTGEVSEPAEPPAETKPNFHLRHWNALKTPDKEYTKPFDRGRFRGTAINPSYQELRMTEHFGPCGVGWGIEKPKFTLVPAGEELLVFCTVGVWYADRQRNVSSRQVYGVGGDKVIRLERDRTTKEIRHFASDEAYKAAYTDAVGNAFKRIGMAADIHMGLWDDKYTRELQPPPPPTRPATRPATPRRSAPPTRKQIGAAARFAGPFSSGHVPETPPGHADEELIADGWAVAEKGVGQLHAFCELLSTDQKRRIGRQVYDSWMQRARDRDLERAE